MNSEEGEREKKDGRALEDCIVLLQNSYLYLSSHVVPVERKYINYQFYVGQNNRYKASHTWAAMRAERLRLGRLENNKIISYRLQCKNY